MNLRHRHGLALTRPAVFLKEESRRDTRERRKIEPSFLLTAKKPGQYSPVWSSRFVSERKISFFAFFVCIFILHFVEQIYPVPLALGLIPLCHDF